MAESLLMSWSRISLLRALNSGPLHAMGKRSDGAGRAAERRRTEGEARTILTIVFGEDVGEWV